MKRLRVLIASITVTGMLLTMVSSPIITNSKLLSNHVSISGINLIQELSDNYYKGVPPTVGVISYSKALNDVYTEVFLKEGSIPQDKINNEISVLNTQSQSLYMTQSNKVAFAYLYLKGIINYNELPDGMLTPLNTEEANLLYTRVMNKSKRFTKFTTPPKYKQVNIPVCTSTVRPTVITDSITKSEVEPEEGTKKIENKELLTKPNIVNNILLDGPAYKQDNNEKNNDNGVKSGDGPGHQSPTWTGIDNAAYGGGQAGAGLQQVENAGQIASAEQEAAGNNNDNVVPAPASVVNKLTSNNLNASEGGVFSKYTVTQTYILNGGVTQYYFYGTPIDANLAKAGYNVVKNVKASKDAITVTYQLEGPTKNYVLANLAANVSYRNKAGTLQYTYIPALTTISNGTSQTTYLPQSSMGVFNTDLQILDGKYLRNTTTGAEAILLKNSHLAIVGNNVIDLNEPATLTIGNHLYYNFNIIDKLMSNGSIGLVTGNNLDTTAKDTGGQTQRDLSPNTEVGQIQQIAASQSAGTSIFYDKDLTNQEVYTTYREGTKNSNIQSALVQNVKGLQIYANGVPTSGTVSGDVPVLNLTQATRFMSSTITTLPLNPTTTATMVINWYTNIPTSAEQGSTKSVKDGDSNKLKEVNPTLAEINNLYYKEPTDPTLKSYFNNNIAIDNILANYIFDTKNERYFGCGYITPQITFLSDKVLTTNEMQNLLDTVITKSGETIGDKPLSSFFQYDSTKSKATNPPSSKDALGASKGTGGSNQQINLLKDSRLVTSYGKSTTIGTLGQYGPSYLLSPSGIVYQAIQYPDINIKPGTDAAGEKAMREVQSQALSGKALPPSQLNMVFSNKTINAINTGNKSLQIVGSNEGVNISPLTITPSLGQTVSFNGLQFMYNGEVTLTSGNQKYFEITPTTPITGWIDPSTKKVVLNPTIGSKGLYDNSFTNMVENTYLIGQMDNITSKDHAIRLLPSYPYTMPVKGTYKGLIYFNGGLYKDYDAAKGVYSTSSNSDGVVQQANPKGEKALSVTSQGKVNVQMYPRILLSADSFSAVTNPYSDGQMPIFMLKKNIGALKAMPNLFTRGLTQGVIDSVVSHNYKYSSTAQLPNGARVLIGNTYYTAEQGELISDPSTSNVKSLTPTNVINPKGLIASIFTKMPITVGTGTQVPLDTYLVPQGVGITDVPSDVSLANYSGNILFKHNGQLYVYNNKTSTTANPASDNEAILNHSQPYTNQPIDSFIYQVEFDNQINFMSIGDNLYTIVYSSDTSGPGIMDNYALNQNSLSGPDFNMLSYAGKTIFQPVGNAMKYLKDFSSSFFNWKMASWISLLTGLVAILPVFAFVMIMVSYAIYKVDFIFYRWSTNLYRSGKKFLWMKDPFKWFSIGTIDSTGRPPNIWRVALGLLIFTILGIILLNLITTGNFFGS